MRSPTPVVIVLAIAAGTIAADSTTPPANGDPCAVEAAHAAPGSIAGMVRETTNAAGYSYLRLASAGRPDDLWAAVPATPLTVGQCIVLLGPQRMVDFKSTTLKRTFPEIFFATLAATPDAAIVVTVHTGTGGTAGAPATDGPVPRASAPDGRTVAEIYAQRQALAGQVVSLRGRVVKRSDGILGKTWLRLGDGTGTTAGGGTDLLVTTQGTAEVGAVVVARGTVRLDLDLGYGYRYAVLIEDATLEP